ncbi:MAG: hypothetical protein ACT4O4_02345 [Nitrospiraceae bacterium]
MRTNAKNQRLLIAVATLALVGMIAAPATAKSSKHDKKLGPAWRTVGGTVKHLKGNTYTVEDYEGNQIQLYIGQGTKQIRGHKKVGDPVRAEITRDGFANSIQ